MRKLHDRTLAELDAKQRCGADQEKVAEAKSSFRGEPEPLRRELPPAAPYPMDALGPVLGSAARRVAEIVQAPDSICAQSFLAAASLAAQAHADVPIDGRRELLSLYLLSIAESGERKSAADDISLEPHRAHERRAADLYQSDAARHASELKVYEKRRQQIVKPKVVSLQEVRDLDDALKAEVEKLGEPPLAPLKPWMLASQPTIEGLHVLTKIGQASLGLFHSDGGEFLGGYAMNKDNRMRTGAALSKWWDCGELDRIRVDGADKLFGRRLSLHLMIQPVIAETILGDSMLCGQGFLPRCLLAWPESRIGTRNYSDSDPSADGAIIRYRNVAAELLGRRPSLRPGTRNELEPRLLSLSSAAKNRWVAIHDAIEADMRAGADFVGVRAWAAKGASQVARIAGILTIFDHPDSGEVRVEAIDQAAELVLFYLGEAVRIVGTCEVPIEIKNAGTLLMWCRSEGIQLLHSAAVLQFGPGAIRSKRVFDAAITELERCGWVAPIEGGAEVDGKHRRRVWLIRSGP